jgi:hypothetical protein
MLKVQSILRRDALVKPVQEPGHYSPRMILLLYIGLPAMSWIVVALLGRWLFG